MQTQKNDFKLQPIPRKGGKNLQNKKKKEISERQRNSKRVTDLDNITSENSVTNSNKLEKQREAMALTTRALRAHTHTRERVLG
jgi:hypothetical protein